MALFGLDDPQRQQAALITLVLVAGTYLFWTYVYSPLRDERVLLEDRVATLESHNEQARTLTQPSRVADLRRREAEFRVALAAYETMLPTESEVSALLEDVARAALTQNVDVVNFAPLEERVGENLVEIPYDVRVQGGLHEIGRFLADVANLPRLVRPVVVSLQSVEITDPNDSEKKIYEVLASLTLSTFMPPGGVSRGVVSPDQTTSAGPVQRSEEDARVG
ncbi:MAG TPA: type 4a pilus biogenesis protein PilO [Gemmatimonadota bacterium]|nr:type 4a pilus biogenesis protein PilO [Gemmatimonadota bacterium]